MAVGEMMKIELLSINVMHIIVMLSKEQNIVTKMIF